MKNFLFIFILALSFHAASAQELSYTCPRDTILGCNSACFTIKGYIPDLRALADDYSFVNVSAGSSCRPYVDPGGPGPSTNLTVDDTYSAAIPITFNFPFYGATYSNLYVSTNGYITFDVPPAGISHYGIMNSGGFLTATAGNPPVNLPDPLYNRAIIMGPYHDLDPAITQPTQLIKYNVYGSAPNRKWILSFYKVPLFDLPCNSLIENTHQIILHESTGVIEVYIRDKQICTSWNEGRAMIGLQDFTRTKGIMAPGRRASDPPWGSIGMNETWRFIPKNGATLYRKVELLDATGTVVAVGDTVRIDVNTFETTFPNVCPPAGNSRYVIKTTYQKIDDPTPGATIYSLDTINVIRQPSMPVGAVPTSTACGQTTGTIVASANAGTAPFTFTLTGPGGPYGPFVSATNTYTFTNLGAGTYTVNASESAGCMGTATATVTNIPNLTGTFTTNPAACPGINNGNITVTPTVGPSAGPYNYTLTGPGGPYTQLNVASAATFNGLAGGSYSVTFTNAAGCSGTITPIVVSPGSVPTATITKVNTSCNGANDGTVTVTFGAAAGTGPFDVTLNPGAILQSGVVGSFTFTNLVPGTYSATFTNAAGCSGTTSNVTVLNGTSPTATIVKTNTSCPGATDGSVTVTPAGGLAQGPYDVTLNPGGLVMNGVATAAVFTGLGPNTYTATFTNASGCTGTTSSVTILNGTAPATTISSTNTTCPGVNDGTVTVTPSGGAAQGPYNVTLNPGGFVLNGVATAAIFTGLAPNNYTATFTNAAGCNGSSNVAIVSAGPAISGTAVATATSCPTVNNGTITVTPGGTGPYVYTLNPGNIVQNNNPVFTGLAPNTYTITYTTGSGCTGTVTPNPVVNPGPFLTSTFTPVNPPCSYSNNGSITINPGGSAPYSFTLNGPGGPYTQATPTFNNLAPGTYDYIFTDGNGCTGTGGPVVLTTNNPIGVTVTPVMPLCNGNSNGSITLAASGGVNPYGYALSPFTITQPSGTFTGLAAGTYTFRITDNVNCFKDTTVTLSEPTLLTATANNSIPSTCFGNDGTIVVNGFGGAPAYQYSIDGTTFQAGNSFTAPAVGAYPNIKVKDANGCIAGATTNVVLVDGMFLSLGPDTTICVGKSVRFDPQTNAGTSVFNWRPLDPVITNPNTLDANNIRNATATPTDTAVYILNAQWGACVREDTISVFIKHKPVVHLIGKDTAICQHTFAYLNGTAENTSGPVSYSWTPSATIQNPTISSTIATPDTSQTYMLTITDNYGCNFSVFDLVRVTVQPPVPAFAGNDTIAILGVPHQLFGSGGASYLWSPAAPLNLATAQNPLAILTNDQQFVLQVTDIAGCIGYDTVFVKAYVGPNYYVPNAFSPNGDGLNDIFRAIPVGIAKTEWFRVFNRYGQLVFETNQWLKGWDGKYKGKSQPMGVYVWVVKGIDKNGRIVEMKGTVMLVQ